MGKFLFGIVVGAAAVVWGYAGFPLPAVEVSEIVSRTRAAYQVLVSGTEPTTPPNSTQDEVQQASPDDTATSAEPDPGPQAPTPENNAGAATNIELFRVIDGNTVELGINGTVATIHYTHINAPEAAAPCFEAATNAHRELLQHGPLRLLTDNSQRPAYHHVYAGNVLVTRELVRQGWAQVARQQSAGKYYAEFLLLEEAAAKQALGCHRQGFR